jgi:hypothetical protein
MCVRTVREKPLFFVVDVKKKHGTQQVYFSSINDKSIFYRKTCAHVGCQDVNLNFSFRIFDISKCLKYSLSGTPLFQILIH